MRRGTIRLLVTLALGLLVALLIAAAPPGKVWRIGLFHVGLDHVPPWLEVLREELHRLGYAEGKNLRWDWRNLPDEAAARETAQALGVGKDSSQKLTDLGMREKFEQF
jgi:hypothetical protein